MVRMNLREGRMGMLEGISLAAISMCITGLFTLDPESTYSGGNATYITLPFAAFIALLLFCLITEVMKRNGYDNFSDMLDNCFGALGSNIVSIILLIGFSFSAYAPLMRFVQIMHGLFFAGVSYRQILLFMLPASVVLAWLGFEALGRTAKCYSVVILAVTAVSFVVSWNEIDSYRLYPLVGCSAERVVTMTISQTVSFLPALMGLLISSSGLNGRKTMRYVGVRSAVISALICFVVQLLLGMIYSYSDLSNLIAPLCRINHLRFGDTSYLRLDKLAQMIWMNGGVITGAFYIYSGASLFARSFKISDIRPVTAPITLLVAAMILMEFDGIFTKYEWLVDTWNNLGFVVFAVPILAVSLAALLKKRPKGKEKSIA